MSEGVDEVPCNEISYAVYCQGTDCLFHVLRRVDMHLMLSHLVLSHLIPHTPNHSLTHLHLVSVSCVRAWASTNPLLHYCRSSYIIFLIFSSFLFYLILSYPILSYLIFTYLPSTHWCVLKLITSHVNKLDICHSLFLFIYFLFFIYRFPSLSWHQVMVLRVKKCPSC